jgi:ADP-ribose pyrophosphatase YjhB (NUDIX family)
VAAILTGMATPSTPVPPPRREARRFAIPTPADLRHPRQLRTELEEPTDPTRSPEGTDGGPSTDPPDRPSSTPRAITPIDQDLDPVAGAGSTNTAPGESAASAAPSVADRTPPRPTPATLPRPTRAGAPAGAESPAEAAPQIPEPAESGSRRMFPNPATLMASGRGARKVRPAGLRHRRLPKVEETSAGGVVLDLSCDPPAVALIARHDRRSRLLWSLPKGHVEEGETPEQAALREVHEETGLVGRIVAPLGVIDFWFVVEDKRIHKTVHHYVIEAIGGELSDADLEVEAVEWIPYDQVVRRLAYGDERRLVEKVAQIVPGVR